MADSADFLSRCQAGMSLATRDRRQARIERVSAAEGLIFGEVPMHGACVWRADGRFRDAPFGAPGPLDLVMPDGPSAPRAPNSASMQEALDAGDRLFCCD